MKVWRSRKEKTELPFKEVARYDSRGARTFKDADDSEMVRYAIWNNGLSDHEEWVYVVFDYFVVGTPVPKFFVFQSKAYRLQAVDDKNSETRDIEIYREEAARYRKMLAEMTGLSDWLQAGYTTDDYNSFMSEQEG